MLLAQAASAQDYPAKSVRLIAAAAPGGNPDVLGRMLAAKLAQSLGRPFVVENIPGAGGVVAAELVARAAPDGHVLMMGDSGAMAINIALNPKVPYHPLKDFTLITALAAVPTVLVSSPSVPASSLQEFIALAKGQPGKLSYASAGAGNQTQLAAELLNARTGIGAVHVPYKSGAEMVTAVLSEQVQITFPDISILLPLIQDKKIKALAVTSARRHPQLPDVPTMAEFLPGYEATGWVGIGAPKITPTEIVDKLNTEINAALADPNMKGRLAALEGTPLLGSPADFRKLIAHETEKWGKVIRAANIKVE